MRTLLRFGSCSGLLITLLLVSGYVLAQEHAPEPTAPPTTQNAPANAAPEHGNSGEDQTAQFKHSGSIQLISRITGLSVDGAYWLAVAINFGIVVAVIAWAAKKNLLVAFRNRTALIQTSLEEARQSSQEAHRRISKIESRLGRLDDEINQIRQASEKEATAEETRIQAAAEEEIRRIVQSAEQEIAAAAKSARRELTEYAADLAVSLASKQIRVDVQADKALVRHFARQVSGDGVARKKA